jgi:hypothetical protein
MEYKFKIHNTETQSKWFYVEMKESEFYVMNHFSDARWTSEKLQLILTGIENSKETDPEDSFNWSSEDLFLKSNKYGVFFFDLMAERAGKGSSKQDLVLKHDDFIPFMEDFKKFIEENS